MTAVDPRAAPGPLPRHQKTLSWARQGQVYPHSCFPSRRKVTESISPRENTAGLQLHLILPPSDPTGPMQLSSLRRLPPSDWTKLPPSSLGTLTLTSPPTLWPQMCPQLWPAMHHQPSPHPRPISHTFLQPAPQPVSTVGKSCWNR